MLQSRGTKSQEAHKWARGLHNPCHLRRPLCFTSGDKIRTGPQVGQVVTELFLSGAVPDTAEQGTKSEVAHKWAQWLYNPSRLGGRYASKRGTKSDVAHKWAR